MTSYRSSTVATPSSISRPANSSRRRSRMYAITWACPLASLWFSTPEQAPSPSTQLRRFFPKKFSFMDVRRFATIASLRGSRYASPPIIGGGATIARSEDSLSSTLFRTAAARVSAITKSASLADRDTRTRRTRSNSPSLANSSQRPLLIKSAGTFPSPLR